MLATTQNLMVSRRKWQITKCTTMAKCNALITLPLLHPFIQSFTAWLSDAKCKRGALSELIVIRTILELRLGKHLVH
jgi:hypothetical protein